MKNQVAFQKNNNEDVKASAIFIAQLVKEGVTFDLSNTDKMIIVIITGGY